MARQSRPWRRRGVNGAWYSTVRGEQVWLAPPDATKTQAQEALTRELAARQAGVEVRPRDLTVTAAVNLYLADREASVGAGSLSTEAMGLTVWFLGPFVERFGTLAVSALSVAPVEAWVASRATGPRPWNPSTRAKCTSTLKSCFRWAVRAGLVPANPLDAVRGPTPLRRTAVLTRDQADALIAASDEHLGDFLRALLWTGCRPIEMYTLTAEAARVEDGVWMVRDKIRGKTGAPFRRVYLNREAKALTAKLLKRHPTGLLFRNSLGGQWTRESYGHRLKRMRKALGIGPEGVAYSLRHLFATDLLEQGESPATVAELLGHRSTTMVMSVYNQLGQRTEHLRRAVEGRGKGRK